MITQVAVQDLTKLSLDAEIELIEIDGSAPSIGAGILRYCNQTNEVYGSITWQGNVYQPYPIMIEGLAMSTKDATSRPTMSIGNVTSSISTLMLLYQDMVGAKVTIRRVLAKYLDGAPSANTSNGLPTDVYYIERKIEENFQVVRFELSTDLDMDDVMLPNLKCTASHCVWMYRSTECGYTGRSVADRYGNTLTPGADRAAWNSGTAYIAGDEAYVLIEGIRYYGVCTQGHTSDSSSKTLFNTAYWTHDQCSKRLSTGCEKRFTNDEGYPFLAFLGMTRLPV